MARSLVPLLALLLSLPARAQGPVDPTGRLPPVRPPAESTPPEAVPRKATPVERPTAPLPQGAILEQVSGTVVSVDRQTHRFTIDAAGEQVTLSMDRNTMVYTPAGLGTVLDVVPGAPVRAGRNAELVAYWVQVRPVPGKSPPKTPEPTPGQGTGPGGGSGAAASEPRGGAPPGAGGTTSPAGTGSRP